MTRSRFIRLLKEKGYVYKIEGDKIIITVARIDMSNTDDAHLAIRSIPPGVVFNNRGSVWLESLTSISPGVEFNNGGSVHLSSLTSLPPGVEFKNGKNVYLRSLIGGFFGRWGGNIEGIDPNSLLNLMISKGIFI